MSMNRSVNNNTHMGLVISLCSNSNHLISLIPQTASNFRHLLSCGTVATILGPTEVTNHQFAHRACILASVFHAFLLQFSFFFLVVQVLGRPSFPFPCFAYLDSSLFYLHSNRLS